MLRHWPALALIAFAALASGAAKGPANLGPGMQNPGYQERPDWFKESFLDIRDDLKEATAADKRLALYFYQDGCPYCAKLLQEGLGDRQIGTLARERFDWVAINIWGDREATWLTGQPTTEKRLAAELKVQFTPTLLLLDEGGKTVLRINGYYPPHKLGAALAYVAERREQVGETFADFFAARSPIEPKGKLHTEGGFLQGPLRLADNRDTSKRPLVAMFEQPSCTDCDLLHEDILRRPAVALSLAAFDAVIVDAYSRAPIQTPDGRSIPIRDWAAELGIDYTPSLVFFDTAGREVFRTEGWLKAFHIQGALDYVATGAYVTQPSFQRFLAARRQALIERGIAVDIME
jgi:thioredoxin-related protein